MARVRPSEFGGTTQRNGIAPPVTPLGNKGHTLEQLSAAEKLHLIYATGQEINTTLPPDPEGTPFEGLEPLKIAEPKMPVQPKWIDSNG